MKLRHKRMLTIFAAIVMIATSVFFFAACADKEESAESVTCTFVIYDDQTTTVSGAKGAKVEFPDVTRDGYVFDGWFTNADFTGGSVSSAWFDQNTTYYAKWEKGYELVLDADGGSIADVDTQKPIYVKANTVIADVVRSYAPVRGDNRFAYWRWGDDRLTSEHTMPASKVTLTAVYEAKYTVHAYFQKVSLDGYEYTENYLAGYAIIGEEFETPAVTGFSHSSEYESETDDVTISAKQEDNIFSLHYDRNEYTVTISQNNPSGESASTERKQIYGADIEPGELMFDVPEGCRFLGWSTWTAGDIDDCEQSFTVDGDMTVYALWNIGYSDSFGGEDYVFLQDGKPEGNAVLCRGGVDIPGEYNARRDWYEFGEDTVVCVKLNDNGTFVLRASRNGAYTLFENGALSDEYRLTVTDWDDLTYICVGSDGFTRRGKYAVMDDGSYEATFSDGTSFVFTLGTYRGEPVFAIRGDEYDLGVMALLGQSYPLIMLDGFGTAVVATPDEQTYYEYSIDGDIVTLVSADGQATTVRVTKETDGAWYDVYDASTDKTYTQGASTLTLDGCRTAVYTDASGAQITGSYALESSIFGGYIVTVRASAQELYRFRVYEESDEGRLEVKENTYAEYGFVDDNRKHVKAPYLVVNGDAAVMYDASLTELSRGRFVNRGKWSLYTVSGDVAGSAENKNTTMLIYLDTSTELSVYSIVAQGMTDPPTELFYTEYAGANGSTLTIVSAFAVYADSADKIIASGVYRMYQYFEDHFVMTAADGTQRYFAVAQTPTKTFTVLQSEPQRLLRMIDGSVYSSRELLIDGSTRNGKPFAVYSEHNGTDTVSVSGTLTEETKNGLQGEPFTVYTFTPTESGDPFKFVKWSEGEGENEAWYFSSFYEGEPVLLTTYYRIGDDNVTDIRDYIAPTADGTLVYSDGETKTQGTYTKEQYKFGDETVTVFTFTPTGGEGFMFTLTGSGFRTVTEVATYTSGGDELALDSKTHTARYTHGNAVLYLEYVTADPASDAFTISVHVMLDEKDRYFDIKADGTFLLRGDEEGAYFLIENGTLGDSVVSFDGHGGVTLIVATGEDETDEIAGTYTRENDVISVAVGGDEYSGKLGQYTMNGEDYPAFFRTGAQVGGKYLDRSALAVLDLDNEGRATKYDTYGNKETGLYTVLDDGLVYYRNDDGSDSAMYSLSGKYAAASDYAATFYAPDFASIVFKNGIVRFNNNYETYFVTDGGKIYTYALPQTGETPNKYGFVKTPYDVADTIRFVDPETGKDRTYTRFDGLSVTLSNGSDTLEFTPNGDAEFSVEARYKSGSATRAYNVTVRYERGEPVVLLSQDYNASLNGSSNKYTFTRNYEMTVDFARKTFSYDAEDYAYGLTAYDYTYVQLLLAGSSDPLLDYKFGALSVEGRVSGGVTTYGVSGYMYYLYDSSRNPIAFTGGTLSTAGITSDEYGHLFACKFTVGDETYLLHFFLTYNSRIDMYTYIVYSCARVTDTVSLSGGTLINSTFVYTTGFSFVKPKTDISAPDEYYKIGEAFIPTLEVNGKLLCVASQEKKADALVFTVREYAETTFTDYYYYLALSDGKVTPNAALTRYRAIYHRVSGTTYSACVLYDASNAVFTIYSLNYTDGTVKTIVECTGSGNNYTVTTDTGEHLTFIVTADGVELR